MFLSSAHGCITLMGMTQIMNRLSVSETTNGSELPSLETIMEAIHKRHHLQWQTIPQITMHIASRRYNMSRQMIVQQKERRKETGLKRPERMKEDRGMQYKMKAGKVRSQGTLMYEKE